MSGRAPAFLEIPSIEGGGWIHNDERETEAIGDRVPGIVVTEIEYFLVTGIFEPDAVATVIEVPAIDARDIADRAVAFRKGGCVPDHEHTLASGEIRDCTAGEVEED